MTMPALGPRTLSAHISSLPRQFSPGWQARGLSEAGSESLFWRGTSCNIHRKLYIVILLRRIGFGCSGFILKVLDDCSGQVGHVPPMLITTGLGCNSLVLLLFQLVALCQLGLSPSFVRLTLASAVPPSLSSSLGCYRA